MLSAGLYLRIAVAMVCGFVEAKASSPVQCPVPLKKGMQWTYEGKVEWTVRNSAVVLTTNVHWVMEVVDVVERGAVRASVVRGFPDELAWYEPNRTAGFCVLLTLTNRVYHIPADSEKAAQVLATKLTHQPYTLSQPTEEWLLLPLVKGLRWGGDVEREDNNYCWYVEGKKREHLKVEGYPANRPADVWTVSFRTNPDHQIIDIVEGLGITRYVFVHHGTVASADVRLVCFRH